MPGVGHVINAVFGIEVTAVLAVLVFAWVAWLIWSDPL